MENNKRDKESLKSYFSQIDAQSLILCAPTDIGVRRNNGRNGARFAPKAILSCIKKMNYSQDLATPIQIEEVSSQLKESSDFHSAQVESAKQILNTSFYRYKRVLHIGGGHDHAFPLLTAINTGSAVKCVLEIFLKNKDCSIKKSVIENYDDIKKYTGLYEVKELNAVFKIQSKEIGFPTLQVVGQPTAVRLRYTAKDNYQFFNFVGKVEFTYNEDGSIKGFNFSQGDFSAKAVKIKEDQ